MRTVLLIGLAGAAGAVCRHAVGAVAGRWWGDGFAYGTLAVNVVGCLLLGALLEADRRTGAVARPWRLLLGVGFLGAFTTFSAFGHETLRFLAQGASDLALLNIAANLILGLGAVWVGWVLARSVVTA